MDNRKMSFVMGYIVKNRDTGEIETLYGERALVYFALIEEAILESLFKFRAAFNNTTVEREKEIYNELCGQDKETE